MKAYVLHVYLKLCIIHSALVAASNMQQSIWLSVAVDMDRFLKYASLESTTNSELSCASLAMRKSADLYCFQPQQCYLPAGGLTAFRARKTMGGWNCRSTNKRRYYISCLLLIYDLYYISYISYYISCSLLMYD